ncbi:MAG: hypothetical protein RRC07_04705 [Anaerolineae bacterium]|nr:hypothetical protein [Anaerolineae bacterium]
MRRNRFRFFILMLMLAVNVALVAVAWQVLSTRRAGTGSRSVDAAHSAQAAGTARGAYALAEPVAVEWAGDARLVRARGDWPEGTFNRQLASWVFVFYSAERGETAQITVQSGKVQVVDSGPTTAQLALQPPSEWQVDSDAIVESFLDSAGGELFLDERSNVSMVLSLSLDGSATWTATLIDWDTGELMRRDFNAKDGYLATGV